MNAGKHSPNMVASSQEQGRARAHSHLRVVIASAGLGLIACAIGCSGQAPDPKEPVAAATPQTQPEPISAAPVAPPAAVVAPEPAASTRIVVKDVGLSTPESVYFEAEADVYLVSNIQGTPFDKDDNGFISKLSPEGQIIDLKWIDGAKENVQLNAPKGLTVSNGVLYVADIDTVRKFDAKSGEPKGEVVIKGSTFLNDVTAASDGTVYVTDSGFKVGFESTGTDAVYKLVKDKAKPVIKSKDLKGPNGVLVDDAGVWVVSFSGNELANVKSGKREGVKALPKGSLDGVVKTNDGKWLVSSWETGEVFIGSPTEDFVSRVADVKSPADIGYDSKRNRVLVPLFMDNAVVIEAL
jgi:hypothetical protein